MDKIKTTDENHKHDLPNQNPQKSESETNTNFIVRAVGIAPGPLNPITQKPTQFHVVLGAFNSEGAQMTHQMKNGEQRPIVWLSLPLPIEEDRILL